MGHWHGPDVVNTLLAVLQKADPGAHASAHAFVDAMLNSGMLVDTRYYVPGTGELYEMHAWHRESRPGALNYRWVMCRETFDALADEHRRQMVRGPILPLGAPEPQRVYVAEAGKLFGRPIRVDPAARRPMLELDTDASPLAQLAAAKIPVQTQEPS
jgi:hypothetical protein